MVAEDAPVYGKECVLDMSDSLTGTSRFISLILRHKPEAIGITLDEHG